MRLVLMLAFIVASSMSALADVSTYRLKVGDTLDILVWQEEGLQRQVIVAPDGTISFPFAGHLRARGRTARQVEQALTRKIEKFISEPLVSVTVLGVIVDEYDVFVMGQVGNSGKHTLQDPTTVMQALSLAGGLTVFAAKTRIKIVRKARGEQFTLNFNYFDVRKGRDMSSNIYLRNGDVVVVPERGLFGGLFE